MRILHLTLKKKWFDMILSGEKYEEYRDIKYYWMNRLLNYPWGIEGETGIFEEMRYHLRTLKGFSSESEMMKFHEIKFKQFDIVRFRNGYGKNAPEMDVEFKGISVGHGIEQWGGRIDAQGDYLFTIRLGKVLSTKNIN